MVLKVGCASVYSGVEFDVHVMEKQLLVGMCFMCLGGMSQIVLLLLSICKQCF